MSQRALQLVAVALLLFVGAALAGSSFTFKDDRWDGAGWLYSSMVFLALAFLAAHQRPRSG